MSLIFPSSPNTGDTHITNGSEYIFDGVKWKPNLVKYGYNGVIVPNISNTSTIDLSSGNFFNLDVSEQTNIVFSNPPSSLNAQKFYVKLGVSSGYEDIVNVGFDLENASYDNASFSVSSQESDPYDIVFKPDGTKMYIIGLSNDRVFQYTLSTPWDISTTSYDNVSFSISSQESIPVGLFFKSDGTKMYVLGAVSANIYQYTLSTPWDIATASYDTVSFNVSGQDASHRGIFFKSDGTKMYTNGLGNDNIYQYTLSTPWDISTASYETFKSVGSEDGQPIELFFSTDGTKMQIVGLTNDIIYSYTLSTPWDVSTATYDGISNSLSISAQEPNTYGMFFDTDGAKMYIVGFTNKTVFQYTTGGTSTSNTPVISWPNTVLWETGSSPTLPSLGQTDLLEFYSDSNGTIYYGKQSEDNIS
jgi:hypothetical protein